MKKNHLTSRSIKSFQKEVYAYYKKHARRLPWRGVDNPYHILVSEVMLQQTQVSRVIRKYPLFISTFPSIEALRKASFRDVLSAWSGLGYNRRAKYLHELARTVVGRYGGVIPQDEDELKKLPGIGQATAASFLAFAFNRPTVFIETNIRSVFIHYFFSKKKTTKRHSHILENVRMMYDAGIFRWGQKTEHREGVYEKIQDEDIFSLVEQTLDRNNSREWYSALMDYGTMLKEIRGNPGRKSVKYIRQSRFEGSRRQLRGKILRFCLNRTRTFERDLYRYIDAPQKMVREALKELCHEGFVVVRGGKIEFA